MFRDSLTEGLLPWRTLYHSAIAWFEYLKVKECSRDCKQSLLSHDMACIAEKSWRWKRLDLIFTMRDIYINSNLDSLTKYSSSSRNIKFKAILTWKISEMIMNTIQISTRIDIAVPSKGASSAEFDRKKMETKTTTWSEFSSGRKVVEKQILRSEEINEFKIARL